MIDINRLTLGDLAYFEKTTGKSILELDMESGMVADAMVTLVALMLFRDGKAPTRDAARALAEDYTMEQATALIGTPEEATAQGE